LASPLQVQFSKNMVNVRFCGCQLYFEATSDILVTHSRTDHLGDLRFARGKRRFRVQVAISAVGSPTIAKPPQQACGYACRASLLASHDINQEWSNLGEASSSWNVACSSSLSPGNNFLGNFGDSNRYN
jgi:ribonuclease BN (tRNA processing enzyme)